MYPEKLQKKYDKNIHRRFVNKIRKLQENPELHKKAVKKTAPWILMKSILRKSSGYFTPLIESIMLYISRQ